MKKTSLMKDRDDAQALYVLDIRIMLQIENVCVGFHNNGGKKLDFKRVIS